MLWYYYLCIILFSYTYGAERKFKALKFAPQMSQHFEQVESNPNFVHHQTILLQDSSSDSLSESDNDVKNGGEKVDTYTTQSATVRSKTVSLDKYNKMKTERNRYKAERDKFKIQNKQLQSELALLKSDNNRLKKSDDEIRPLQDKIRQLENKLSSKTIYSDDLLKNIQDLKLKYTSNLDELNKSKQNLSELELKCMNELGKLKELKDETTLLEKYSQDNRDLKDQVDELKDIRKQSEKKLDELKCLINDLKEKEKEFDSKCKKEKDQLKDKIKEYKILSDQCKHNLEKSTVLDGEIKQFSDFTGEVKKNQLKGSIVPPQFNTKFNNVLSELKKNKFIPAKPTVIHQNPKQLNPPSELSIFLRANQEILPNGDNTSLKRFFYYNFYDNQQDFNQRDFNQKYKEWVTNYKFEEISPNRFIKFNVLEDN